MAYIGKEPGSGLRGRFIYTATAGQTSFTGADSLGRTLTYTDSEYTDVFLNGVKLDKTDYTATSGTSIVLDSGASADDTLEILAFDTFGLFSGEFAQDVSVGGDLTASDDIKMTSDSAQIAFGADSEVTLTHVADTGLTLKHTATADDKPINLTLATGETDMAANDVLGKISFQAPDEGTGTDAILVSGAVQARAEGDFSSSSNATSLDFMTGASEAATTKMTLTSAGALGIGTTAPDALLHVQDVAASTATHGYTKLHIEDSDHLALQFSGGTGGETWIWFADDTTATPVGGITYYHGGPYMAFRVESAERMRILSDGTVCIGKTSDAFGSVGTVIRATGPVRATADGTTSGLFNRLSSDGNLLAFYKDSTFVGSVVTRAGVVSSFVFDSRTNGSGLSGGTNQIQPTNAAGAVVDNTIDLGSSTTRFDDVFATNDQIETSDQNEKQNIASLTSAEITAAKAISKLFKTYKWKDKVASKGDSARTHTGVIAQEVQSAMSDAGLDPTKYAFWCSDTWWQKDVEVAAVEAVEAKDAVYDSDGNVVSEAVDPSPAQDAYTRIDAYETADEAPEGATERTRLGIRYSELLAFIGAATEQRLADIETRLAALEG